MLFERAVQSPHRIPPWKLPHRAAESEVEYRSRQNEQYFDDQVAENRDWWNRIGEKFKFGDARVLEFGCGHGALAIGVAEAGAADVLGVDLDEERVAFASRKVRDQYPELLGKIAFSTEDIRSLMPGEPFDYIVSKDTLEHVVEDLPGIADHLHRLLKPNGKLIVGFSPLYYSPFGDHGRLGLPGAWLHAVLPRRLVLKWTGSRKKESIGDIGQLGLNGLTPRGFRALFSVPAWRVLSLKYNGGCQRGYPRLMAVMSALRRVRVLEKYCTVSIYAVIQKTNHVSSLCETENSRELLHDQSN